MREKTYVEDVDRNMYDFRNDEKDAYRIKNGLTEDIVEKISEEKHDPEWMHDFRLNSLKVYHEMRKKARCVVAICYSLIGIRY